VPNRAGGGPRATRGAAGGAGAAWRGAAELLTDNAPARAVAAWAARRARGVLRAAATRPERVVALAAALAVLGWGLDTQTRVESDVTKLVPQNLGALQDLQQLQRSTGVGGQIDVLVEGDDLTDPKVVAWMTRYQQGVLKRYRYDAQRGCGRAEVCPAFSLPDLFRDGARSKAQIRALLDAVPPYFSQGVITGDRRAATMSFGIRLMPLAEQQRVLQEMRRRLDPPPGVTARLAGLPVLVADANAAVSSPLRRAAMLLAGLLAVGAVLLLAFRQWRRAVIPLVPIVLATGWSALVLFAMRIPLNPMSVTLGALVVAISTEFSVLLSERYRAERLAGRAPHAALAATYRSTGAAVLASGATAIAGFAVLVVSDIAMLRDFGFVTVVDLAVSLLGVLVVLPAVLMVAERRARDAAGAAAGSREALAAPSPVT
jgi:hydrophobe/amphiphile efflux-3 (HAE3) family protein